MSSIKTLVERYNNKKKYSLIDELSLLLSSEVDVEEELSEEEKSTLSCFRCLFDWDVSYRINVAYHIPTDRLYGSYETDSLEEFKSKEDGEGAGYDYDDLDITEDDIYGGETFVDGKEVVVKKLRPKKETWDAFGLELNVRKLNS